MGLMHRGVEKMHIVGGDDRHIMFESQIEHSFFGAALIVEAVPHQLGVEAIRKHPIQFSKGLACPIGLVGQKKAADRPLMTGRKGHKPLG